MLVSLRPMANLANKSMCFSFISIKNFHRTFKIAIRFLLFMFSFWYVFKLVLFEIVFFHFDMILGWAVELLPPLFPLICVVLLIQIVLCRNLGFYCICSFGDFNLCWKLNDLEMVGWIALSPSIFLKNINDYCPWPLDSFNIFTED